MTGLNCLGLQHQRRRDDSRHLPPTLTFKKGENVGGPQLVLQGRRTGIHPANDIDAPRSQLWRKQPSGQRRAYPLTDEKEDPATGTKLNRHRRAGEDTLTPESHAEEAATARISRTTRCGMGAAFLLLYCCTAAGILPQLLLAGARRQPGARGAHRLCLPDQQVPEGKESVQKGESAISFQDVQDRLVYVSSSFSTRTSYENQTKKAITNKFVSQAMTDFLKHYSKCIFWKNRRRPRRSASRCW